MKPDADMWEIFPVLHKQSLNALAETRQFPSTASSHLPISKCFRRRIKCIWGLTREDMNQGLYDCDARLFRCMRFWLSWLEIIGPGDQGTGSKRYYPLCLPGLGVGHVQHSCCFKERMNPMDSLLQSQSEFLKRSGWICSYLFSHSDIFVLKGTPHSISLKNSQLRQ